MLRLCAGREHLAGDVVKLCPAQLGSVAGGLGVVAAVAVMHGVVTAFGGAAVGGGGCGLQDGTR